MSFDIYFIKNMIIKNVMPQHIKLAQKENPKQGF